MERPAYLSISTDGCFYKLEQSMAFPYHSSPLYMSHLSFGKCTTNQAYEPNQNSHFPPCLSPHIPSVVPTTILYPNQLSLSQRVSGFRSNGVLAPSKLGLDRYNPYGCAHLQTHASLQFRRNEVCTPFLVGEPFGIPYDHDLYLPNQPISGTRNPCLNLSMITTSKHFGDSDRHLLLLNQNSLNLNYSNLTAPMRSHVVHQTPIERFGDSDHHYLCHQTPIDLPILQNDDQKLFWNQHVLQQNRLDHGANPSSSPSVVIRDISEDEDRGHLNDQMPESENGTNLDASSTSLQNMPGSKSCRPNDTLIRSILNKKYGPYKCSRCYNLFSTSQKFAAHVRGHYRMLGIRREELNRLKNLNRRSMSQHKGLRITSCSREGSIPATLKDPTGKLRPQNANMETGTTSQTAQQKDPSQILVKQDHGKMKMIVKEEPYEMIVKEEPYDFIKKEYV